MATAKLKYPYHQFEYMKMRRAPRRRGREVESVLMALKKNRVDEIDFGKPTTLKLTNTWEQNPTTLNPFVAAVHPNCRG